MTLINQIIFPFPMFNISLRSDSGHITYILFFFCFFFSFSIPNSYNKRFELFVLNFYIVQTNIFCFAVAVYSGVFFSQRGSLFCCDEIK